MKNSLFVMLAFSCFLCICVGQQLASSGTKIPLSPGAVEGVALDPDAGRFFVQQLVYTTESKGLVIRTHRRLSSWSLENHTLMKTKDFDLDPVNNQPQHRCGTIAMLTKLHRLLICGSTSVLIVDATDLRVVGSIPLGGDQKTYDLAVDENQNRVFVLSSRTSLIGPTSASGVVRLSSYSLSGGAIKEEMLGPVGFVDSASLAVDPAGRMVAVALTHRGGNPWTSYIYTCDEELLTGCADIAHIDPVSQMTIVGHKLLVATELSDRKQDCIIGLDLGKHSVSADYCAPTTGVRYALGYVDGKYIVGFTGTDRKAHLFSEEYVNVQNTFALWCAANSHIGDSVNYLRALGVHQAAMRIVASRTTPMFLAYGQFQDADDNELDLYVLSGCN